MLKRYQKTLYIDYIKYMIFTMLLCFILPMTSYASNYMIDPIYPENQRSGESGFFSLNVSPKDEQTLEIEIYNKEENPIDLKISLGNAITTNYGSIDYVSEVPNILPVPLTTIAKTDPTLTVGGGDSKKIPVHLNMPEKEFDGIILGAVEIIEENKEDNNISGMATVSNLVRYLLPIKLRENDKKIEPNIELLEARADSFEDKNAIMLTIENTEPVIIDKFYVDAEITKKGSKEVLYKQKRKDMQMAPNSSFDYPVFLGTQPFKPGTYVAYITASAQGGYEWDLEKEFTITQEQADEFNRLSSLELEEDNNPFLLYLGIIIAVLVIAVVIYMIVKRNKQKQMKTKVSNKSKKTKK